MFSVAELKRKVKNIIRVTSILSTQSEEGRALATVRVGESEESAYFPVLNFANSFKRHWTPTREREQVVVFHPFGNANKGYILRGLFYSNLSEPKGADNDTEIVEFEDGTRIEYNSKESTLKVFVKGKTHIVSKNIRIKAKNVTIDSKNIKVDSAGNMRVTGDIIAKKCNLSIHQHIVCNTITELPCTNGSGGGSSGGGSSSSSEESDGSDNRAWQELDEGLNSSGAIRSENGDPFCFLCNQQKEKK